MFNLNMIIIISFISFLVITLTYIITTITYVRKGNDYVNYQIIIYLFALIILITIRVLL